MNKDYLFYSWSLIAYFRATLFIFIFLGKYKHHRVISSQTKKQQIHDYVYTFNTSLLFPSTIYLTIQFKIYYY